MTENFPLPPEVPRDDAYSEEPASHAVREPIAVPPRQVSGQGEHYYEDSEDNVAHDGERVPLRGMAMILIAVAIVLGAWGLYSQLGKGGEPRTVAEQTPTSEQSSSAPESSSPAEPSPAEESKPSAESSKPEAPAAKPVTKVVVLNNSDVGGLANTVSSELKGEGWDPVKTGNFSAEILPQTTVYYTEGDAAQKEAAEKLAAQYNAVAAPRPGDLPAEANQADSIVLVVTKDAA